MNTRTCRGNNARKQKHAQSLAGTQRSASAHLHWRVGRMHDGETKSTSKFKRRLEGGSAKLTSRKGIPRACRHIPTESNNGFVLLKEKKREIGVLSKDCNKIAVCFAPTVATILRIKIINNSHDLNIPDHCSTLGSST